MKFLAGFCAVALAFTTLTASAQQRKPTPPKKAPVLVKKTTTTTTKTTQTKKTTTTVVAAKKTKGKTHRVAKRHVRRHRRRSHVAIRHTRRGRHVRVAVRTGTYATGAETSLVGVHILDPGTKLIAMFGNPDEIQNISGGGGTAPVGGNQGGGAGGRGAPGGPQGQGGGVGRGRGRLGGGGAADVQVPDTFRNWSFQNDTLIRAQGPAQDQAPGDQNTTTVDGQTAAGDEATGTPPYFVRWVYKKNPSEFSFIIDKNDRVVQIEGVGMSDSRVHTLKGVTFGSTFGEIIKKYGRPDAYEISGDNIVLRYLTRNKCAFRLNRLQPSKPHQVTAIVVAGGKM